MLAERRQPAAGSGWFIHSGRPAPVSGAHEWPQ
jgi:hypothetical protein